jgi:hypothetical protein
MLLASCELARMGVTQRPLDIPEIFVGLFALVENTPSDLGNGMHWE